MSMLIALTLILIVSFGVWYCAVAGAFENHELHVDLKTANIRVTDGDTFCIRGDDGRCLNIRLNGADAPEKGQVCTALDGSDWDCAGAATLTLREMLEHGTELICVKVGMSYNRIVARCTVDGEDVAYKLIREGLAMHDSRFTTGPYSLTLDYAQVMARTYGIGVWRTPQPEAPWIWRKKN